MIYSVYSAAPPSSWFSPQRPAVFSWMACLVLGLSVAAATLQKGLLSVAMGAAQGSSAATKPIAAKLTDPITSCELVEMQARAGDLHSPMSPASVLP